MTEHEREAFDRHFREQAWGMDVSEDVAWEIWQAGRTQRGVPDVSALKYVAECFLENVEEVTELLLAAGRADNIVALCNDLSRIAERAESALSITPPAEHTSDYSCPHCGAKMTQVSPADPDCDALYCNECGFNEPADSENGADIDDGTNPVPEKDIDPLFQGPDVPIEDALGAMEEEQRLDNEHFEDSLDSAISGQSKQDRLIDSVNAELCSMAYDIMLSHTISGEWPASEAAAKAKHDQLLAMVKELRGLKGRCAQHDRGQDSEPVFWWDGDMSDLDDCVRKNQTAWHTIPLYTRPAKAQRVPEGWTLQCREGHPKTINIYRSKDGAWCGGGVEGEAGASGLRYEFFEALLSTIPPADKPEGEWVKCSERLPTEADADANGEVWWVTPNDKGEMTVISMQWSFGSPSDQGVTLLDEATHWKPTGLTRPAEPDMGGEK